MKTLILLLLVLITASSASAALVYNEWRGTTSDWNTGTNWQYGYVPQIVRGADNIRAGFKGSSYVWPVITSAVEAYNITLGGPTGGTLTIDSGSLTTGQHIAMGVSAGENGTLYINGGTINTGSLGGTNTAHFMIGQAGNGTVYMNDGTVNLPANSYGNLRIAYAATGSGTLYLNGGTINANDLLMPYAAAGSLKVDGGKLILIGNDVDVINGFIGTGKIVTTLGAGYSVQATWDSGTNKTTVMAIPEPATLLLLGLGSFLLRKRS